MHIYDITIPAWTNSLKCLKAILAKAQAHASEQGYDSDVLLSMRLYPDMFPLSRQVQIACDLVARGGARLSQSELPSFADDETTIDQLQQRVDKALAFVGQLNRDDFEGSEERELEIPAGGDNTMTLTGQQYVVAFVAPNLYFHMATAYNLLRTNGVPLGKRDFLAAP